VNFVLPSFPQITSLFSLEVIGRLGYDLMMLSASALHLISNHTCKHGRCSKALLLNESKEKHCNIATNDLVSHLIQRAKTSLHLHPNNNFDRKFISAGSEIAHLINITLGLNIFVDIVSERSWGPWISLLLFAF